MKQKPLVKTIIEGMLEQVKAYGIKEVSLCEYQTVCNRLSSYSQQEGDEYFSKRLTDRFIAKDERRCQSGDICPEYFRFVRRAIRMMLSYAETGVVDFSNAPARRKYVPTEDSCKLIGNVLDYAQLRSGSRYELEAVMRHFFCYTESKGIKTCELTDDEFFDFMFSEASVTNAGSMGRTLRALRYVHAYLKANRVPALHANLSMLQFKNAKVRMIPPFSQEEISCLVGAASSAVSRVAKRDHAVLLLGFDTGLRGSDIQKLKLSDIDWKEATVTVKQSKTERQTTLPLHGTVMNAVADYILEERPECGLSEVFITSRNPYRPLASKGCFGWTIRKYSESAGVKRMPGRGFHSLRRSFATEMSLAGVELSTISQMLGHNDVDEARPYLSYNREQISFCAMGFSDVPIRNGAFQGLSMGFPYEGGGLE